MQIEKGVVMPVKRSQVVYPYEDMEIGDSFKVDGGTLQAMCYQNRKWGKKLGRVYTARKSDDGVRVWRVS
jgi:hypothetical protein